jgi:hypothetical protein
VTTALCSNFNRAGKIQWVKPLSDQPYFWILWQYGDSILEKQNRPVLTATCLGLVGMMFFAMGGLISGLAIAKVHAL